MFCIKIYLFNNWNISLLSALPLNESELKTLPTSTPNLDSESQNASIKAETVQIQRKGNSLKVNKIISLSSNSNNKCEGKKREDLTSLGSDDSGGIC